MFHDIVTQFQGLETETPFVDVGGSVFQGTYEDSPNTFVIFEQNGMTTSGKIILMSSVYLLQLDIHLIMSKFLMLSKIQ